MASQRVDSTLGNMVPAGRGETNLAIRLQVGNGSSSPKGHCVQFPGTGADALRAANRDAVRRWLHLVNHVRRGMFRASCLHRYSARVLVSLQTLVSERPVDVLQLASAALMPVRCIETEETGPGESPGRPSLGDASRGVLICGSVHGSAVQQVH